MHAKILKSDFAETVTESEVMSLILAVMFLSNLQAENEKLKEEIEKYDLNFCTMCGCEALTEGCRKTRPHSFYNQTRKEAIKEFAERLKENITDCHTVSDGEYVGYDWTDITHCIDKLLKETVGE